MEAAGEHPVPSGPLAVRWLAYDPGRPRAGALGTARLAFENAGTVPWLAPGERVEAALTVRGPLPPGPYRLAFDLVAEDRYWFSELGNAPLERTVPVAQRIRRALTVRGGDPGPQEEPLVPEDEAEAVAYLAPGVTAAPDWSRRILDAHQEGYAAVGGSIAVEPGFLRRPPPALAPYAPGGGRNPAYDGPLLCPSVVRDVEPPWAEPVEGLPALEPPPDEPWLYDGSIELTVRLRSGRRRG